MMAWRSNHQAVHPDPTPVFSSPACASSLSCAVSPTASSFTPSRIVSFFQATSISIPSSLRKIDVRCSKNNNEVLGWIDAMKAQSPTRTKGGLFDSQEAVAAVQYASWKDQHPSALETFDELMKNAAGKRIAVFLDYDGTLSPIVEDPDLAYMSEKMRATVKEVATHFPTAIISGRGREKVYDFVQLAELYYAGSHGMDIMGPAEGCNGHKAVGTRAKDRKGNDVVLFQPASKYLAIMNEVCKMLEDKSRNVAGAKVEHNKYCVTLHFRRVKEESWKELAKHVESTLKNYPELQLTLGRKVSS